MVLLTIRTSDAFGIWGYATAGASLTDRRVSLLIMKLRACLVRRCEWTEELVIILCHAIDGRLLFLLGVGRLVR